ncbi:MAG: phosphotransferase [Anaerolineales bacterium]
MTKSNAQFDKINRVLSHYSLGSLIDYTQNKRGYVNLSFAIKTEQNGKIGSYFLRQYKLGILEEEIRFEHSLINHVVTLGQLPVARVYPTVEGTTYVKEELPTESDQYIYYAIFDYLPGEDKYTWINPHCTPGELQESAQLLAQYHRTVWGFTPAGFRREAGIADYLKPIQNNLHTCLSNPNLRVFNQYLLPHKDFFDQKIAQLSDLFHCEKTQGLPQLIIHGDFHPGNLKFQDGHVVGLFDFDWAKKDYRLYDLALATFYFCTEWEGIMHSELRVEEAAHFIKYYQDQIRMNGDLPLLSTEELALLGQFIESANLYVLNWTIEDINHKTVNPDEYIPYLKHGIQMALWLDNPSNQNWISALASYI